MVLAPLIYNYHSNDACLNDINATLSLTLFNVSKTEIYVKFLDSNDRDDSDVCSKK